MLRSVHCDRSREYLPRPGPRSAAPAWRPGAVHSRFEVMSDSQKGRNEELALLLIPVVPDGTPRASAKPQPLEPELPPQARSALWFDDPDTRYVVH